MFAIRMTPIDRPTDSMDIPEFATPRDAWNELLTQLEKDQDGTAGWSGVAEWDAYQTAIDTVLDMNLNQPGTVQVGQEFVYGVIASGE